MSMKNDFGEISGKLFPSGVWTPEAVNVQRRMRNSDEILFQSVKARIHERLVSSLDLAATEGMSDDQLRQESVPYIENEIDQFEEPVAAEDRARILAELPAEMFGLGPLEPLMEDDTVSDILVNHPYEVYVERAGQLQTTSVAFADEAHLLRIIQRVASRVGRRVDEVCPMVDARLADGSRVNAIIPPLALDGPKLSIRKFGQLDLTLGALTKNGTLTRDAADFLAAAVKARLNIMVSGGSGAGKTTLLNALSCRIPIDQRIVTIEDSAELRLQHPHVARLETRPQNSEGAGAFSQRDLVRNSLRMRPDRIVVGEVRGDEALDMLQAMNTGHEGSMTTIHANSARDALRRLELMLIVANHDLPVQVSRAYIASAVDLIVHVARLKGGVRRVMSVNELSLSEQQQDRPMPYVLSEVFNFQRHGVDDEKKATGVLQFCGEMPKCIQAFVDHDVEFDIATLLKDSAK